MTTRDRVQDLYFQALNEQDMLRERTQMPNLAGLDDRAVEREKIKVRSARGQFAALKVVISLLELLRVTGCNDLQMTKAVKGLGTLIEDSWPHPECPREIKQTLGGRRACFEHYRGVLDELF